MKYLLITLLTLISLNSFSKGGGGGAHASASHSSSHSESTHASSEAHTATSEHVSSSSVTHYNTFPNGVYWALIRNNHTHNMDTIKANSSEELTTKIEANEEPSNLIGWVLIISLIGLMVYVVYEINKK